MKVDDIIDGFMSLGRGTLLAKFDVESAYRIILIYPNDRYLFGMLWQGNYFVDMALPFGLCSAPYIFSSVVDLAEWTALPGLLVPIGQVRKGLKLLA